MFAKRSREERVLPEPQQVGELLTMVMGKVSKGLRSLDGETARYWAGHANDKELQGAINVLCKILLRGMGEEVDEKILDWVKFYQEVFGLELDPASITLPSEREGFGWIVLVANDLTRTAVFEKCRERFAGKVWKYYDDLNKAVTVNDRESIGMYAIRVRDRVEADEEHKGKSANMAKAEGLKGMTNLERMLLELWYHWKTQDHLDKNTLTICSGSRYADGDVPNANWNDDKFNVSNVNPDNANDNWRVREKFLPIKSRYRRLFWSKYFCQPVVIFEMVCSWISNSKYLSCSIIFKFQPRRNSLFKISILICNLSKIESLLSGLAKVASSPNSKQTRQRFSILTIKPKRSRLGAFFPNW